MLHQFNLISKFILLSFVMGVLSCNKEKVEVDKKYSISEEWEIFSDEGIHYKDGAVYKNEYIVFGNNEPIIKSFDLITKSVLWEYELGTLPGWGEHFRIYDQYLVLYNIYTGLTVFDLTKKELVNAIKFSSYSDTSPTYFDGKVYIAVQNHNYTKVSIKSINTKDGEIEEVYEWQLNENLLSKLTSPIVVKDSEGNNNFILSLLLYNKEEGDDKYSETFFLNVNNDDSINWIDTLSDSTGSNFVWNSPVVFEENIIVHYKDKLLSYNIETGEKNWVQMVSENRFANLVVKNNELYAGIGNSREYAKFDLKTGEKIWEIGSFLSLNPTFEDFELFDNHLVLVKNNYSFLYMFDDNSSKYIKVDNQFENGIANPKFYTKDGLFITHQKNKVIGFKLKPIN